MTKNESKMISFEKAVNGLDEVIDDYKNENNEKRKIVFRDSAIQRFEICFDLAWKSLKEYLFKYNGLSCASPKVCFREAFLNKIFSSDEGQWIDMTDERNLLTHSYDEDEAEKAFKRLPEYLVLFKELLGELKK